MKDELWSISLLKNRNNHNGNIDKCKLLIDAAAKTGANAVKTQSFTGRDICTPKLLTSDYPNWNTKTISIGMSLLIVLLFH